MAARLQTPGALLMYPGWISDESSWRSSSVTPTLLTIRPPNVALKLATIAHRPTKGLNAQIRQDAAGELLAVLLERRRLPGVERMAELVKKIAREQWEILPNPFERSLDEPLDRADGLGLGDLLPDTSSLSDPALLMELDESEFVEADGA